MIRSLLTTAALFIPLLVAACGDNAEPGDPTEPDAAVTEDSGVPDAGGCDPATALPLQWRPIATVAKGAVTTTTANGVTTAIVDATAGGFQGAADNPYLYVDLAGGKVEISDVDALASSRWHIALKRANIRANGGDSGPGGVTVAVIAAPSLDQVTAAPADAEFGADDWATDDCTYVGLPAGEPASRLGDWYGYDDRTHQVAPKPQVYVIRTSGAAYKLRIATYYGDDANPMRGAIYRLEWARL